VLRTQTPSLLVGLLLVPSIIGCENTSTPSTPNPPAPVCLDGDIQPGTTACGLNGGGFVEQTCTEVTDPETGSSTHQWDDSERCVDEDVCTNDETQDGSTCGLNNEGFLTQRCEDGAWVESAECSGADVCVNDSLQTGAQPCGLNDEGFMVEKCEGGAWVDTAECTGTDVCVNGSTQSGLDACGLNDGGTFEELCSEGEWSQTETCADPDVCVNESTEVVLVRCPNDSSGVANRTCVEGAWNEDTICPERLGNVSYTALGRTITFRSVDLNGTGTPITQAAAGSRISLRARGSVESLRTNCPGCITQFYVRLDGVMNLCLGSLSRDWSFDESTTFTAPEAPGIYYINPTQSWEFRCVDSTAVSTEYSEQTVAILVVD